MVTRFAPDERAQRASGVVSMVRVWCMVYGVCVIGVDLVAAHLLFAMMGFDKTEISGKRRVT